MLDSKLLLDLISEHSGDLMKFARENKLVYPTMYSATRSNEKLSRMNITMFMDIAHGLGMTTNELIALIEVED